MKYTSKQIKKHGEVIMAYERGEKIEVKAILGWTEATEPLFSLSDKYRVKEFELTTPYKVSSTPISANEKEELVYGFSLKGLNHNEAISKISDYLNKKDRDDLDFDNAVIRAIARIDKKIELMDQEKKEPAKNRDFVDFFLNKHLISQANRVIDDTKITLTVGILKKTWKEFSSQK